MQQIRTLVNISVIIATYYLVYYIYVGILNPIPALGDSWDYHIPIAQSILNGSFLTSPPSSIPGWHYPGTSLTLQKQPMWYYPGSSETITSLFIFLHIPLTLSNIFATLALFFSLRKLALTFKLDQSFALLFAITFCTLNVILRWANAISIDVWVGVFFTLSLILLEAPRKTWGYFAKLGFVLGMLLGSKYTTVLFVIILLALYGRRLIRYISLPRLLIILIPFTLFGLFWYLRNYFLTGNPIYPLPHFSVSRVFNPFTFYNTIWVVTLRHPLEMFNAAFGEYKLWLFSVPVAAAALVYQFIIKRRFQVNGMHKLFLLGLLNLACFFMFLSSDQVWIMVSNFRYSLPVFIPLILGIFLLAVNRNKGEMLGVFAIANMINVLSMAYYPKLILIYLPLSIALIWYLNRGKKLQKHASPHLVKINNNKTKTSAQIGVSSKKKFIFQQN
jgi:hypothetical protein